MDDKRKCFTVIWKIKNFSYISCNKIEIYSPNVFAHSICQTNWYIILVSISEGHIGYKLQRCKEDSAPDRIEIDYDLSTITWDGSVINSETIINRVYKNDWSEFEATLITKKEDILVNKKHLFLHDDTLTIRCRIWKSRELILESKCFADTRIETECGSFVASFEKFSQLQTNSENSGSMKSLEELKFSSIHLHICDDGKLSVEFKPVDEIRPSTLAFKFKIFILDVFKNKIKFCEEVILDKQPFCIPLVFSKGYLSENEQIYLPNDVVNLYCEIYFSLLNGLTNSFLVTEDVIYEYYSKDNLTTTVNKTNSNLCSKECHRNSLKEDLISLFEDGVLCDIKLKTETDTFPAHKVVLSARSPVFKSMFETDMKEEMGSCVDIDGLDADTVRKMLIFMYSDTLDNLNYESAKNLYFAADKYDIVSLRHECSNFLRQNLLNSNCCEVLLLADKHKDTYLKKSVINFISENDEAVLFSDQWKILEEDYSRLTTEILRNIYLKNRKT